MAEGNTPEQRPQTTDRKGFLKNAARFGAGILAGGALTKAADQLTTRTTSSVSNRPESNIPKQQEHFPIKTPETSQSEFKVFDSTIITQEYPLHEFSLGRKIYKPDGTIEKEDTEVAGTMQDFTSADFQLTDYGQLLNISLDPKIVKMIGNEGSLKIFYVSQGQNDVGDLTIEIPGDQVQKIFDAQNANVQDTPADQFLNLVITDDSYKKKLPDGCADLFHKPEVTFPASHGDDFLSVEGFSGEKNEKGQPLHAFSLDFLDLRGAGGSM